MSSNHSVLITVASRGLAPSTPIRPGPLIRSFQDPPHEDLQPPRRFRTVRGDLKLNEADITHRKSTSKSIPRPSIRATSSATPTCGARTSSIRSPIPADLRSTKIEKAGVDALRGPRRPNDSRRHSNVEIDVDSISPATKIRGATFGWPPREHCRQKKRISDDVECGAGNRRSPGRR